MDFFRWKRTFLRALGPALLCAILAGWGVYALTADERPTYRSQALLNTGIMTGRDGSGTYVRDLVLNELENIMNLARSFETREALSALLFAKLLSLDGADSHIISPRAYDDFFTELDSGLVARYKPMLSEHLIYEAVIADRDSLKRYGEATAEHPLIEILYGDDPLVGIEALASLRVNRKGMSDLLEISYSTVDAAWCKLTLDEHIKVFLDQHKLVEVQRSGGALTYFKEATSTSRDKLDEVENRLRDFATNNKIINYYEQTRFIASLKNQVDNRYTEEKMKQAAADSTLQALEKKLAKRMDLVRLNNIVDDRRRELGQLSREQVRLEIMSADSSETAESDLENIQFRMDGIRKELSQDIGSLQGVYNGPEGLELGRLITEWLVATIQVEEAKGKIEVLDSRKVDFGKLYTNMASLGSTMKKIEREVHIAEEDYLENLRNLNEALQKEHSQRSITDLRLVDQPALPTKPEKSKRLIMVLAAFFIGGIFPIILAIALELLSGAILSFAEGERRSELIVIGGIPRWSTVRRVLRSTLEPALRATTGDLLWQGLRSRGNAGTITSKPHVIVLASFRPGAGKSYVAALLAERLAQRGMRVFVVTDKATTSKNYPGVMFMAINSVAAMAPGADARTLTGSSEDQWSKFDVVIWELPAMATGRVPVDIARSAHDALLIHPASAGWTGSHAGGVAQMKDTLGRQPQMVLNGISADVLLNEWGSTWKQIQSWSRGEEAAIPAIPLQANLSAVASGGLNQQQLTPKPLMHSGGDDSSQNRRITTVSGEGEGELSQNRRIATGSGEGKGELSQNRRIATEESDSKSELNVNRRNTNEFGEGSAFVANRRIATTPPSEQTNPSKSANRRTGLRAPLFPQRKPLFDLPEEPTTPAPFPLEKAKETEHENPSVNQTQSVELDWESGLMQSDPGATPPPSKSAPTTKSSPTPSANTDWEQNLHS